MKTFSAIILQDDIETAKKVADELESTNKVKVLGIANDGKLGLEMIAKSVPELVIIDLVLKGLDGMEVLALLKEKAFSGRILVLSSVSGDASVSKACGLGADYFMLKPVNTELILKRIEQIFEKNNTKNPIDDKLSKIFISVGIPPHIKGYAFLREGIKMVVKQPEIINNITKRLYPMIGDKFDTTPSKVERAIRHAIEVSWAKGRIDTINNLFGVSVFMGEKPTNGEFIALIADKMLLDGM